MLSTLLIATALAAEPGFYSPDGVAAASLTFARYAEALGPRFDKAQSELGIASRAAAELETSVLLLGDRAPAELRQASDDLRRQVTVAYLRTQAHISLLEEDSTTIFGEAMERAIAGLGDRYTLSECTPSGGIAAMTGPGRGGTRCEGADLNATLAATMDKDPALTAAVDEILSIEWPGFTLEKTPRQAIALSGDATIIYLAPLADALIGGELARLDEALEAELEPLYEPIDSGDEAALKAAEEARARYEAAMAAEGAKLLAALDKRAGKLVGELALCPNPVELGGCPGTAADDAVTRKLKADRKLAKMLR